MPDSPPSVDVRRSTRRRRTVSAYRDGDRTVVLLPARMSRAQEREWVERMLARLEDRDRRATAGGLATDEELAERAKGLADRFVPEAGAIASVRWVTNQRTRWASCTPIDRTIRVSDRVRTFPTWVLDYVLVHELAHFVVPAHGADFWAIVRRHPRAERARGFLEGVAAAVTAPTPGAAEPPIDLDQYNEFDEDDTDLDADLGVDLGTDPIATDRESDQPSSSPMSPG